MLNNAIKTMPVSHRNMARVAPYLIKIISNLFTFPLRALGGTFGENWKYGDVK